MKILIGTVVSNITAKRLKEALEKKGHEVYVYRPWKDLQPILRPDLYIALGCSKKVASRAVINAPRGVLNCVHKANTFDVLKEAGVPTLNYCWGVENIPESWDTIVCREGDKGFGGKNLEYYAKGEVPPQPFNFFTEYCPWRYEYRVVVVLGKALVYYKKNDGEFIHFNDAETGDFTLMKNTCIKAAKALGIDLVGFDVLALNKKKFKILEANSGSAMIDTTVDLFVKQLKAKGYI